MSVAPAAAATAANPWAGVAGILSAGIGSAIAGPSGQATGYQSAPFDSSGWNVVFGGGSIDSNREQQAAGQFDQYMPYAVLFVGVMVVWRMTRKR